MIKKNLASMAHLLKEEAADERGGLSGDEGVLAAGDDAGTEVVMGEAGEAGSVAGDFPDDEDDALGGDDLGT